MSAWDFQPGLSYRQDLYMQQSGQALANAIGQFQQDQKIKQAENEAQQYLAQKNQTLLGGIKDLTDSNGVPYIDPQVYADIMKKSDNPKSQNALIEGELANVAFKIAREKEITTSANQNAEAYLNTQHGNYMGAQTAHAYAPAPTVTDAQQTEAATVNKRWIQGPDGAWKLEDKAVQPGLQPLNDAGGNPINDNLGKPMQVFQKGKDSFELYKPPQRMTPEMESKLEINGYFSVPNGNGFNILPKSAALADGTAQVKAFNDSIGKQYGLNAASIYKVNQTTPGGSRAPTGAFDPSSLSGITYAKRGTNMAIAPDEAAKNPLGTDVLVPNPAGANILPPIRMTAPEWNAIMDQWKALPRAGQVSGGNQNMIAVISPSGVAGYMPPDKIDAALAAGYKRQ